MAPLRMVVCSRAFVGGFDLAAEWMGWDNVFHCEWNEFGQKVLKYYWPKAISYADITKTDFTIHRGEIDILTGGFPCQPFSTSGQGKGDADERYLWEEMLRAVREVKPKWVVGENVRGITSKKFERTFEKICSSMELEGYQVQPILIPATSIGAWHQRYRIWIIAYSGGAGQSGSGELLGRMQPTKIADRETSGFINFIQGNSMPYVCSEHDGISSKLDGITFSKWREESLKAAGNAIVPQVAHQIFKAIEQYEQIQKH